ncbi:cell division protein SepF [Clostridium sp. D2Q-11]|uniref:Cell division protein SepF n=1 Tax=Anaeromonas frigoriresistens TaxID=2683708 RepID=A0A942UX50_9FIRM|nr:cell division protein SepF [Anaeromonas frigoriresistens]MBS4539715.1 cell division protein SepF [Anaeromonas frigoriresistens]
MSEKGSILNKVKYFIGLEDLEEEYDEMEENENLVEDDRSFSKSKQKKVFNIHTNSNIKLVIHEPTKYEDIVKVIDDVKNRKPVVLNLQEIENEEKRKVFDFTSGAIYTLEGNIQKVAKDIFILAPSNVEIDGRLHEELKNKGLFPWKK